MTWRLNLMLSFFAASVSVLSHAADRYQEQAIEDLANRLQVPLEAVVVGPKDLREVQSASAACARIAAPIAQRVNKDTALILIVKGQKHYYFAAPGKSYRYCELPSTKKRGPIGPPVE